MKKSWVEQKLPKLTQEVLENQTSTLTSREIGLVIKILPNWKSSCSDVFYDEFYQMFKEQTLSNLQKLLK